MLHSFIALTRTCLGIAVLLIFSAASYAADQQANVGQFNAQGMLALDMTRLQEKFPDGLPIAEFQTEISNGFYFLTRKGYAANGACRKQAVQLMAANGLPLVVGSVSPGARAWVREAMPVNQLRCSDDGCHALKWVVPIGAPPLQSARCDITALSDNKCKCHLNDGSGTTVTNGDFCSSITEVDSVVLIDWIRLAYITGG